MGKNSSQFLSKNSSWGQLFSILKKKKKLDARGGFQYLQKTKHLQNMSWTYRLGYIAAINGKNGIFFDFQNPLWLLTSAAGKKKLRKSMNIHDFITAEKINLKKLSEIWKNSRKTEKNSRIQAKNSKGGSLRLLNITPKMLKKRAWFILY